MWTGVSTHKNGLGQACAVCVLLLLWMAFKSWRSEETRRSEVEWVADLIVVAIAFHLLRGPGGSYSATSIATLGVGFAILLLFHRFRGVARFVVGHLNGLILLVVGTYWLFGESLVAWFTSALGRDGTLTGRTHIWEVLLKLSARNPLLGLGYGGFWGLHPDITSELQVGQSHNGYLGVYLELGVVGLVLLGAFVLAFCGRLRRAFDESLDLTAIGVCCLILTLLYNVTESAFLTTGFLWGTMVLVSILTFTAPATPLAHVDVVRATRCKATSCGNSKGHLDLIRPGGHFPRGGHDVRREQQAPVRAPSTGIHRRV